jgi:type II secretory pathway component PulF
MEEELLEALADCLAAGVATPAALEVLEGGGRSGRDLARALAAASESGELADAIARAMRVSDEEAVLLIEAERRGRLPAALALCAARRREARALRRQLAQAAATPLLLALLTVLLAPLPRLILGGGYAGAALRGAAAVLAVAGVGLLLLPWLFAHPRHGAGLRARLARIPLLGRLVRLDAEAGFAGALGVLGGAAPPALEVVEVAGRVWRSPQLARAAAQAARIPARASSAQRPSPSEALSPELALTMATGAAAGGLADRLGRFRLRARDQLTARLRGIARVLAFALLVAVSLQGLRQLMSQSLPGLMPGLGVPGLETPELKELERELQLEP